MFSKTTEYALRATIYIARMGSVEHKLGIDEIARAIDSPRSFTAKILQLLTGKNRIISSVRGPNGGFFMTERAKKLSVRSILDTIGEEHLFTTCILGLKECSEKKPCPLHEEYKPIKQKLIKMFENNTILDLAKNTTKGNLIIKSIRNGK